MGHDKDHNVDIASKYQVELNSKYTKQGGNSGENTKESILNIIRNQSNKTKESEWWKITIKDLLPLIPDMLNLFLSGFIFMTAFGWLNNKAFNVSIVTIWSLFISVLIKSFYSTMHYYFAVNIKFTDSVKILIFSLTGLLLAVILTYLKQTSVIRWVLYYINNKSVHEDIFDDIIDYKKRTMMKIYIKSSDVYYLGRFSFREEKGLESWIVLIDYYCLDLKSNKILFDPETDDLKSSVAVNLKDVERLEIIYEGDSDVWKKLIGNQQNYT